MTYQQAAYDWISNHPGLALCDCVEDFTRQHLAGTGREGEAEALLVEAFDRHLQDSLEQAGDGEISRSHYANYERALQRGRAEWLGEAA